ncbi:MAG: twin-arginine translocase subunit TatC [Chloroflexi bacterium]|nr:twin-arginine translocase subunit TatC [Chloroflexota bacterium]
MRRLLRAIWRVLIAPYRGVRGIQRAVHNFIYHDPEEVSVTDSLVSVLEHPASLLEHIDALRKHLFRALIGLFVATLLSFAFAAQLLDFLAAPVGGLAALQAITVTEPIGVFMRVSLLSGFALALPYIALELLLFVQSGLKPRERILLLTAIPAAALLFILGLAFTYYIMLPAAIPFMINFLGIVTKPRPDDYIKFVTGVMFWIGIAFQFPLVVYALAAVGWVNARSLATQWRLAVIGIALLAAAVTPTVDPVNMTIVMAPMVLLYFLSIGLARVAGRRRARRASK